MNDLFTAVMAISMVVIVICSAILMVACTVWVFREAMQELFPSKGDGDG